MWKSKRCFTCNKNKFSYNYPVNNRKYQIKSALGKCFNCRLCEVKLAIKRKKYVIFTDKFEVIPFTPTLLNIIKLYFRN